MRYQDDCDTSFDRMRDDALTDEIDARMKRRSFTPAEVSKYQTLNMPRFYVLAHGNDFDIIDSHGDKLHDERYRVQIPDAVISLNDAEKYVDRLRAGEQPEYYGKKWQCKYCGSVSFNDSITSADGICYNRPAGIVGNHTFREVSQ